MVKWGGDGLVRTKNVKILIFEMAEMIILTSIVLLISSYALSMCNINVYNEMSL